MKKYEHKRIKADCSLEELSKERNEGWHILITHKFNGIDCFLLEREIKPETKKESFNFKKALIDIGVDRSIVSDWLKVRAKKKAANTETAFIKLQTEISKSGMNANACIKTSVENSWCGFKSQWIKDKTNTKSVNSSW